ncbi:unnamed protein product [Knipowitschia caucasica]
MGAEEPEERPGPRLKTSRDVHFRVLPDRYEPLEEEHDKEEADEEEEQRRRRKEEKKHKKKMRYKKYRKNVGKALRFSWRCLISGLQSMVPVYTGPVAVVTTMNHR